MRIIELECKKCKHSFTRLVKEKKEVKNEKCCKCGNEVKIINDIILGAPEGGCSNCSGCGGGCASGSKGAKKK